MTDRDEDQPAIDLSTPLTLMTAFRFPLQTRGARRELLWGAGLLLLPGVGWLLNMGHRISVVHHMQRGRPAWPAWTGFRELLKHGFITLGGMACYYAPGAAAAFLAYRFHSSWLALVAGLLLAGATIAIPGFMSHYCRAFDPVEIYNPLRALSRCLQGGPNYWRAWGIALSALAVSFVGLLGLGLGFLVTSVWFWQVAGFSFACVFTQRFNLAQTPKSPPPSPPSPSGGGEPADGASPRA